MTSHAAQRRPAHVEHCMGTVFTIDVRDNGDWRDAVADVVDWLHRVDTIFSTYLADSDLSRLRRGEITVEQAHPLVAEVLDVCVLAQHETDGYFSALWSCALDPTGLVKGWAIERASAMLRDAGSANHAVNGGGDIQTAGEAAPGEAWRIGVSDPSDHARVLTVVSGRDIAIATSGRSERGDHILNPFTGKPATELSSVTVVGRSLTAADVYATAAVAMGVNATKWLETRPGYEGLVVGEDGSVTATSAF